MASADLLCWKTTSAIFPGAANHLLCVWFCVKVCDQQRQVSANEGALLAHATYVCARPNQEAVPLGLPFAKRL